jgi:hypothetical protein
MGILEGVTRIHTCQYQPLSLRVGYSELSVLFWRLRDLHKKNQELFNIDSNNCIRNIRSSLTHWGYSYPNWILKVNSNRFACVFLQLLIFQTFQSKTSIDPDNISA